MPQTWIPSRLENPTPDARAGENPQTMVRILKIIYILYSIEAGVFLVLLPWMNIWDTNILTFLYPQFLPLITNPYLKGAVLGLGIANIMIGIHEVVHFRKFSKGIFYR